MELPIWVPGYAGELAYGDVEIEGEDGLDPVNPIEPPGSIIGKIFARAFRTNWYLRFFFITRITYEKNKAIFSFDAITANVGNSVKYTLNNSNKNIIDAYFRGTYMRIMGGYKPFEVTTPNKRFRYELFVYTGIRIYWYSVETDLNYSGIRVGFSPMKLDPLLGIQNQFTWKRWFISLQADYGGVFITDNSSYQLSFSAHYRLGRLNSLKLGWTHLYVNHEGNFRKERYRIKTTLSGPTIGIAFHF